MVEIDTDNIYEIFKVISKNKNVIQLKKYLINKVHTGYRDNEFYDKIHKKNDKIHKKNDKIHKKKCEV